MWPKRKWLKGVLIAAYEAGVASFQLKLWDEDIRRHDVLIHNFGIARAAKGHGEAPFHV